MATAEKIVVNPTYQLELSQEEAEGLVTLIGWGTTGGVAEDLHVRGIRWALGDAGVVSDHTYPFAALATRAGA